MCSGCVGCALGVFCVCTKRYIQCVLGVYWVCSGCVLGVYQMLDVYWVCSE